MDHQSLLCSICLEVFKDPVILSCGHSFCRTCLQKSWTQNPGRECPFCRRRSSKEQPPADLALRNTCESKKELKEMEGSSSQIQIQCSLHSKNLKLFCVDDKKLICSQCITEDHQSHTFCSISKAAAPFKEKLQTRLNSLKNKLDIFKNVKEISDEEAAHIKFQFQQTEKQIKEEFEKIHEFLRTEEDARISDLRREEKEKSQKTKRTIKELDKQINEISSRIKEAEDKLKDDVLFMLDFKRAVERAQYTVPDPQPDSGALIDVAKHLGNLRYTVWTRMKEICVYHPVVLDPNTANSSLSISADLSSISLSTENPQLPDNPERFSVYNGVLGSEGFSSGTHSWVVEVGGSDDWVVGVAEESVIRNKIVRANPDNGFYCIWRKDGKIVAGLNSVDKTITKPAVHGIVVILNWDKGKVAFSSAENNVLLYTFKNKFKKKMYPYFYNKSQNQLKIMPLQTSVTS